MANDKDQPAPDQEELNAMREQVEQARRAEAEQLGEDSPAEELVATTITPELISDCLYNNERGDGVLFAELHRDKFLHIKNSSQWLLWNDYHWQIDKIDESHNAVEAVATTYLGQAAFHWDMAKKANESGEPEIEKKHQNKARDYNKRATRLRGLRGAKNCLEYAHKIGNQALAIVGDEIDQRPWLLPCKNGVIDLKTGKLQAGVPGDYLVKAIPVEWKSIDHPCPNWERFISEIHQDDPEIIAFIQRLLGYSITGLVKEHFIATFVGEGRNGKSVMFDTLRSIMGDLSWTIQPELILEQKTARSSAGPSPDLISLQGRRLVVASETDENRRISGSKVKDLTGGDMICARAPHDRFETNFKPTHTLFLHTNHIPNGLTRDYALYQRLLFIHYPLKFIDDPREPNERQRDPDLITKLADEASGILAWLVAGCLDWQDQGLAPPTKLRADAEQLRIKEDTFQQFYNEQLLEEADASVLFKDIYAMFGAWFVEEIDETKRYIPSKKAIGLWLDKHGFEGRKPSGQATRFGLRLKTPIELDQDDQQLVASSKGGRG